VFVQPGKDAGEPAGQHLQIGFEEVQGLVRVIQLVGKAMDESR
jgi:hypothetical protein